MRKRFQGGALVLMLLGVGCSDETRVRELEPPHGTFVGGEEIVIRGNGFKPGHGGVTVKFATKEATNIVVESDKAIRVTSPAGDRNAKVDITVIFDDGRAFLLANGFQYLDARDQARARDSFLTNKKK